MQVEAERDEIIERIAALDVSKAEVVCCARVPGPGRQRLQEVRTVSTMTAALLGLGDWLAGLGVNRVVMEATSDYWRAPFYLLEDRFSDLAGQRARRHAPAGPAQDRPAGRGVAVQGRRVGRCCAPASSHRRRSGRCAI
jgi:transposase